MLRTNCFLASAKTLIGTALAGSCLAFSLSAGEVFPADDWKDDFNPIASPDAVVGGKVKIELSQFQHSFNYYLNQSVQSVRVFGYLYDSLLEMHPTTLDWQPRIARKIEVSDDKKEFVVHFDERARWSDGQPITSRDFIYTFKALLAPENLTGAFKHMLEIFEEPVAIDDLTVKLVAKEVHWRNLLTLGQFVVLPQHVWEGLDFNKVNFEFPVVSGRYELAEIKEPTYVRLKRRGDWWLEGAKRFVGVDNFEEIEFRFYPERDMIFDAFKKREIDFYAIYTSHRWAQQTQGEDYDRGWIVKQAVHNHEPVNFQGFAMNLRRAQFADLGVRRALAHLLDRERMNSTLMYNQYFMLNSYYPDLYDAQHPNGNPVFDFNLEKARTLLAEAGWTVNPESGKLEKDGVPFVINFLTRDSSSDKFLVIYREALKDVGIELKIVKKDWAAWMKDMDQFNFDMTWAAYGSSLFKDPEGLWHSREADRPTGGNVAGLKSPTIDALIEKQKPIFSISERNDILREIDREITSEVPFILLWAIDYKRLLFWNKFGTPDTVLDKYGDEAAAYQYFWIDPDSEADLEAAIESGKSLPQRPSKVVFDEEYQGD